MGSSVFQVGDLVKITNNSGHGVEWNCDGKMDKFIGRCVRVLRPSRYHHNSFEVYDEESDYTWVFHDDDAELVEACIEDDFEPCMSIDEFILAH